MSFVEQTATICDVIGKESHGGGLPRSSHLRSGRRGGALISELTDIGEASIDRGKIDHFSRPLGRW